MNNRSAYFKSIVGLYKNGPHIFEGISRGIISNEILGHGGFGYDPIFIPEKSPKSFGEMTTIEKNKFSHRGRALEKLVKYLESGVSKWQKHSRRRGKIRSKKTVRTTIPIGLTKARRGC